MQEILTNHHKRPLCCWLDLDESTRRRFDYITESDPECVSLRFFRYKGGWYDLYEFEHIDYDARPFLKGWDGIYVETFFSAVLVKILDDDMDDAVIVGHLYS